MGLVSVKATCPQCGLRYQAQKQVRNKIEADSFAAYVNRNPRLCPSCYHKQKNQEVMDTAIALSLPPLMGTQPQIQWAMGIRHDVLSKLFPKGLRELTEVERQAVCIGMTKYTDAAWWISNREVFNAKADTIAERIYTH